MSVLQILIHVTEMQFAPILTVLLDVLVKRDSLGMA